MLWLIIIIKKCWNQEDHVIIDNRNVSVKEMFIKFFFNFNTEKVLMLSGFLVIWQTDFFSLSIKKRGR